MTFQWMSKEGLEKLVAGQNIRQLIGEKGMILLVALQNI